MEETIRPGTQRRLDMQRYIKEHMKSEDREEIQNYLTEMAEIRGVSYVPTLDQLLDENFSPDVLFLSYVYDKVREFEQQTSKQDEQEKRQAIVDYMRNYLSDDWSKLFDLIRITNIPQERLAQIIANDESVPTEEIRDACQALVDYQKAQAQPAAERTHAHK